LFVVASSFFCFELANFLKNSVRRF